MLLEVCPRPVLWVREMSGGEEPRRFAVVRREDEEVAVLESGARERRCSEVLDGVAVI